MIKYGTHGGCMEKNVVIKIEDEPEELEEFMQVLVGTGIKCRIQKDIHQGNESLQMCFCWDEAEVLRRRTRKAGAKRRRTKRAGITAREVRRWMDATSGEEVADAMGISRGTLYRRLREAEKEGEERIW